MANFISFMLLLLIFAVGFLFIYLTIDFFEYLKKFHAVIWEELCFERPFGIPRKDFFFYPVRPLKFIPFLFSPDETPDRHMAECKKRIKYALAGILAAVVLNFLFKIIF